MNDQPPPLPWSSPPDRPHPRSRSCLRIGSVGCVTLLVLLAVLLGVLILLVKFVWSLRIDQWF